MSATTFEGVVEKGQIRMNSDVHLPEGTKVFIVVPDIEIKEQGVRLHSPRLARPEQAADFEMEVIGSQYFSAEELALASAGILCLPEESEVSESFVKETRPILKSATAIKVVIDERDED